MVVIKELREKKLQELVFSRHGVSVGENEHVLVMDGGDSWTTI